MKSIAYYITAHGYGHGTRSCDIINALRAAAPDVRIVVKTDLPAGFMASRLAPEIEIHPGAFDVGLIQKDSIHVDLPASLAAIKKLYACEEELIARETAFLRAENIAVVTADIPAIPLAAAQRAGISNIACGNFGWDWIYSDLVKYDAHWQVYVDKFRAVYEKTDLLLRQPFAEPMEAFPHRIDLPLLARPGIERRRLMADTFGADIHKKWVLLSFTTLDLSPIALKNLSRLQDYELFTVEPLQWSKYGIHCVSRAITAFSDTLASVDMVLTKPGFGIVSECIANNKPIIYSERENFLEYPILVKAIERYCRQAFIPNAELYAGQLSRALGEIETATQPAGRIERGGAERAARQILNVL